MARGKNNIIIKKENKNAIRNICKLAGSYTFELCFILYFTIKFINFIKIKFDHNKIYTHQY